MALKKQPGVQPRDRRSLNSADVELEAAGQSDVMFVPPQLASLRDSALIQNSIAEPCPHGQR